MHSCLAAETIDLRLRPVGHFACGFGCHGGTLHSGFDEFRELRPT